MNRAWCDKCINMTGGLREVQFRKLGKLSDCYFYKTARRICKRCRKKYFGSWRYAGKDEWRQK